MCSRDPGGFALDTTHVRRIPMSKLTFIAIMLVTHAACTAGESPATSFEARSLAKVELQPGSEVELIELAPGVIGVTETGLKGMQPVVTADRATLDPAELFATLQPGVAVPLALAEAVERRAQLLATGELQLDHAGWTRTAVEPDSPEQVYGLTEQGLSATNNSGVGADRSAFIDSWCVNQNGNFGFCDVDRWGLHSRTRNDVDRYECVGATFAHAATFKFRYRVWWDWTTYGYWTVNENTWRKLYTGQTGGLDYDGECKMYTKPSCGPFDYACITAAPDAGFHMAGWGEN
jgi:hypothetical protein